MANKRVVYSPYSDGDIRAAVLRAAHETMKEMDAKGLPTVGKMKEIMREESAKFRAFGEYMAKKGACQPMAWDDLKKAANKFVARQSQKTKEG